MDKLKLIAVFLFFAFMLSHFSLNAQCPAGEVEVVVEVSTDDYGYEIYWELVPEGNGCGVGAVFAGGNSSVGCGGGGAQDQTPGGYGNNLTISEGPFCLTEGEGYEIHFIDDWGDGGVGFHVSVNGYAMYEFFGTSTDEVYTFTASEPPALDAALLEVATPYYSDMGEVAVKGRVKNMGIDNITSFDATYSVDGEAVAAQTISDIDIGQFEQMEFAHPIPWSVSQLGLYDLDISISNVNGAGNDAVSENNAAGKEIMIVEATQNIIDSYLLPENTFTSTTFATASDLLDSPQDLDFHPEGELWIVNKNSEASGGSTLKVADPGLPTQSLFWQRDGNAWHFMSLPTGIAFGRNGMFATSPGVFDANHNGGDPFTGPTLWSADPTIYAQPSGGNGSHMDMLHETPYGMGIAHERGNAYWVFDAYSNDIVRYDFADDHGPGNAYHGDAIVRRYPELAVEWINQDTPSHLELHPDGGWLYIVDGGNRRVLRLDIHSGTPGGTPAFEAVEPLVEYTNVTGVTWETVVEQGLEEPVGIDLIGDRMLVSDHATGEIIIYDISAMPATELRRIAVQPGIAGIALGKDGRIWYVNNQTNELVKVAPDMISGVETGGRLPEKVSIYPNPASGIVRISFPDGAGNAAYELTVSDLAGKPVHQTGKLANGQAVNLQHLPTGTYLFSIGNASGVVTQKVNLVR